MISTSEPRLDEVFEQTFLKFALFGKIYYIYCVCWLVSVQHPISCLCFRESDMLTNLLFQYTAKILLLSNWKTQNMM